MDGYPTDLHIEGLDSGSISNLTLSCNQGTNTQINSTNIKNSICFLTFTPTISPNPNPTVKQPTESMEDGEVDGDDKANDGKDNKNNDNTETSNSIFTASFLLVFIIITITCIFIACCLMIFIVVRKVKDKREMDDILYGDQIKSDTEDPGNISPYGGNKTTDARRTTSCMIREYVSDQTQATQQSHLATTMSVASLQSLQSNSMLSSMPGPTHINSMNSLESLHSMQMAIHSLNLQSVPTQSNVSNQALPTLPNHNSNISNHASNHVSNISNVGPILLPTSPSNGTIPNVVMEMSHLQHPMTKAETTDLDDNPDIDQTLPKSPALLADTEDGDAMMDELRLNKVTDDGNTHKETLGDTPMDTRADSGSLSFADSSIDGRIDIDRRNHDRDRNDDGSGSGEDDMMVINDYNPDDIDEYALPISHIRGDD